MSVVCAGILVAITGRAMYLESRPVAGFVSAVAGVVRVVVGLVDQRLCNATDFSDRWTAVLDLPEG